MMELPRDGVEYGIVTFTDYPTDPISVEASLDRVSWFPFDVPPVKQDDDTWVGKVLLRGPVANSTNGVPVTAENSTLWARVVDNPEIVPVRAGFIALI